MPTSHHSPAGKSIANHKQSIISMWLLIVIMFMSSTDLGRWGKNYSNYISCIVDASSSSHLEFNIIRENDVLVRINLLWISRVHYNLFCMRVTCAQTSLIAQPLTFIVMFNTGTTKEEKLYNWSWPEPM